MPWSIGEVAERAGLRASAIRYYEQAGLLPRAERRNGRRVYDAEILQWLAVIDLAQHAGFSVAEIKRLLHGFSSSTPASERWRNMATHKQEEVRNSIERLRAMDRLLDALLGCACPSLSDCAAAFDAPQRVATKSPKG